MPCNVESGFWRSSRFSFILRFYSSKFNTGGTHVHRGEQSFVVFSHILMLFLRSPVFPTSSISSNLLLIMALKNRRITCNYLIYNVRVRRFQSKLNWGTMLMTCNGFSAKVDTMATGAVIRAVLLGHMR